MRGYEYVVRARMQTEKRIFGHFYFEQQNISKEITKQQTMVYFQESSCNDSTSCSRRRSSSMTQTDDIWVDNSTKNYNKDDTSSHQSPLESNVNSTRKRLEVEEVEMVKHMFGNNNINNNTNVSHSSIVQEKRRVGYAKTSTNSLVSLFDKVLAGINTVPFVLLSLLLLLSVNNNNNNVLAQETYPSTCSQYAMPLLLKGKKFFKALDGSYIPFKGINYYPRPNTGNYTTTNSKDFYTEEYSFIWERDIAYFAKLNINAVRIYAVDPSKNHDAFMCALKQYGIYVIIGLAADCLDCAVTDKQAPACYPQKLLERGEYIVQRFSRYTNVIGFDAGNEVSLRVTDEVINAPCQKQFIRDMRKYVTNCVSSNMMRHIPIGLAVADVDRSLKALYYNCLTDPNDELESAEYLGMNVYLHCQGNLNTIDEIVGFKTLLDDFTTYQLNIPVVLTEFGCISNLFPADGEYESQRDWFQVDALFDTSYETEFAGGFVFEYNTEKVNSLAPYPFTAYGPGNYGIGYLSPDDCNEQDIKCTYTPFPQFDQLASKYLAVDMNKGPNINEYVPEDRIYPTCPERFPKQADFTWPVPVDLECPEDLTVICPNLPPECNIATHPSTPVAAPVVAPRTPTVPVPVTVPIVKPAPVPIKPIVRPVRSPSSTDSPTIEVTTFYPTIADLNVLKIPNSAARSILQINYIIFLTVIIATTITILLVN